MGMWKYASLKSMEVTHSPSWREVQIGSSVSILNFYHFWRGTQGSLAPTGRSEAIVGTLVQGFAKDN